MDPKRKIVILGAGFGGLRAAMVLGKKLRKLKLTDKYELVLIDKNPYHTYTPTLYEVATTSKENANYLKLKSVVTVPVAEIIKGLPINFINDAVKEIDLINGDIHCSGPTPMTHQSTKFDYLILALGSETNFFDIEGLERCSLTLKSFIDAIKIRDTIYNLAAENRTIKIIIGGGGSTGVELAGELEGWLRELKKKGNKFVHELTIIEASPTLLPGFHPTIVEKAQHRLKKLGAKIIFGDSIEKVADKKISLKSKLELPYDTLIWTGGVKAADIVGPLPLKTEKRGRVEVIGAMECLPQSPDLKLYGKIYGIGDAVCCYDPKTSKPMPGVARAAISQADVAAHNIIAEIQRFENRNQKLEIRKYLPTDYPYVLPIGGKYALAKIGPVILSGIWGWILKLLVEINYLSSIMPISKAINIWLKSISLFIKNDRFGQ